jgi:ADP-heptose:LPS heptosyltransferase
MLQNWDCIDDIVDLPFNSNLLRETDYHCLFEGVIERCRQSTTTNAYRLFTTWMGLNLPDELLVPKQTPQQEFVDKMKENLKTLNLEPNNFLLFQLRASTPVRTPDLDVWRTMINEMTDRGHNVAIIDRDGMAKKIDTFMLNVRNKEKVFNLAHFSPSLDYTVAATSLSKMVVATDSALNHIAASLGVKCYGIYGPFPGEIRLSTYKTARWVNAQRQCAPCFLHTSKPCPEAGSGYYSPCYNNIDIKKTCDEIEEFLND